MGTCFLRSLQDVAPSARMAWCSNFTIALAFAHLVLQGVDCNLLASNSTFLMFCCVASLCLALWLCFVVAFKRWLRCANPGMKH